MSNWTLWTSTQSAHSGHQEITAAAGRRSHWKLSVTLFSHLPFNTTPTTFTSSSSSSALPCLLRRASQARLSPLYNYEE